MFSKNAFYGVWISNPSGIYRPEYVQAHRFGERISDELFERAKDYLSVQGTEIGKLFGHSMVNGSDKLYIFQRFSAIAFLHLDGEKLPDCISNRFIVADHSLDAINSLIRDMGLPEIDFTKINKIPQNGIEELIK